MKVRHLFDTGDRLILELLQNQKALTMSYIWSKSYGKMSYAHLSDALRKLENKGIIKREINPDNKRERLIRYSYLKLSIGDLIKLLE